MLRVAYLHLFSFWVHHLCMSLKCSYLRGTVVFAVLLSIPAGAQVDIIDNVRAQAAHGSFSVAEAELRDYKAANGVTPEYLEAFSWLARGVAAMQQWNQALTYAQQTRALSEQQLTKRKLDAEPHLPTAVGAAYEVQAEALAGLGKSSEAVALLRSALAKYSATSIAPRLQKNLNLMTFVGKPAPALQEGQFLGPKPPTLASLKGSPVLLFFWAHWCADCKGEAPIIARLRQEFAPQGLVVLGPTQFYGYTAQANDVTPVQERTYIEAVRQRFYSNLLDMPVPLSKQNFKTYGASTTPTLVVLNRSGTVAMYHPGAMSYADLRTVLEKAVAR
jgi:thiol-disulfide isomerase/thioredoxin